VGSLHQPTHFLDISSRPSTSRWMPRRGCGSSTSCRHHCRLWLGPTLENSGERIWLMAFAAGWTLGPLHFGRGGHHGGVCPPFLPYFIAPLREVVQVLGVFQVDHIPDVSGHLLENRACMMSSSKSSFKAMSWSIRTNGLLDPRPRCTSIGAVFWAAQRPQDCSRMFCSSQFGDGIGSSQRAAMVYISLVGSLDTVQWNLVRDHMMQGTCVFNAVWKANL
jgi:hypothetical protein